MLFPDIELATFVREATRDRPLAWDAVERLQRACRTCQPVTADGAAHAIDVLRHIGLKLT